MLAPVHLMLNSADAILELSDGSIFRGTSFGAQSKSIAGECVFQTGEQKKVTIIESMI